MIDTVVKYAHTRAYILQLAQDYPSASVTVEDETDKEGGEQTVRVKPELVRKIVRLLDEEDEDGLKDLVRKTYGINNYEGSTLEQIVLDLMHKHKDDIQGVPFVHLSNPLKRPLSRPSSRASTHSFRVVSNSSAAARPDTPSSPLAKSLPLRRPHTPLTSPLSAGLSAPGGFPLGSVGSNVYGPSPGPSPTMANHPPNSLLVAAGPYLSASQPPSPLTSPHFLNAKAVEFRPTTLNTRPGSAMSGSYPGPTGGGRTDTPSPDMWAHRPFDNLMSGTPNSPRRTSGNLAIASPLTSESSYFAGFRPLARSNSGLRKSIPADPGSGTVEEPGKTPPVFKRIDDDEMNDEFSPFAATAAVSAIAMAKSTASTHGPSFDDAIRSAHPPYNAMEQMSLNDTNDPSAISYYGDVQAGSGGDPSGMGTDGMTPFEVLHSVFGASIPPATLEEALNTNGYEFEAAMAWLIDGRGAGKSPPVPPVAADSRPTMVPVTGSGGRVVMVSRDAVRGAAPGAGRGGPGAALGWMNQRPAVATGGRVCRYFLSGECRRADCRFSHDVERALCRFWLRGQCMKGEQCEFLHTLPQDIDVAALTNAMIGGDASGTQDGEDSPPPDEFPTLSAANARTNGGGATSPPTQRNPVHDPGRTRFAAAVKKPAVLVTPNPAVQRGNGLFGVRRLPGDRSSPATPRPSPRLKLRPPSLLPTLPTGEAVNKLYMSYRSRAIRLGGVRNQALSRAAEAWRRGDGASAKLFSREAHELNAKMHGEMVDAAQNLLRERVRQTLDAVRARELSWSDDPMDRVERGKICGGGLGVTLGVARESIGGVSGKGTKLAPEERKESLLDLHGLHSSEGVEALEEFLSNLEKENFLGLAYVVVGQEKHTGTQDPNRPTSRDRLAAGVKEYLHRWQYPWNERDGVVCIDAATHADP